MQVWMSPGELHSGAAFEGHQITNLSVGDMADMVVRDLLHEGYQCTRITTTLPSASSLTSSQSAICIRTGDNGKSMSDPNYRPDYHLMRMFTNNWRHKPGGSAILTYKYSPSNSRYWTNEGITSIGWVAPTITYDSTIYYILYQPLHTGNGICTGCGRTI